MLSVRVIAVLSFVLILFALLYVGLPTKTAAAPVVASGEINTPDLVADTTATLVSRAPTAKNVLLDSSKKKVTTEDSNNYNTSGSTSTEHTSPPYYYVSPSTPPSLMSIPSVPSNATIVNAPDVIQNTSMLRTLYSLPIEQIHSSQNVVCRGNATAEGVKMKRPGKRSRTKFYNRNCAPRTPVPTAHPHFMLNASYTRVLRPQTAGTKHGMAVCFSGQLRRHKIVWGTHINNVIKPNNAHTYVASWVWPDDAAVVGNLDGCSEYYTKMYAESLVAARVDFFHPQMFNRSRFARNTGAMFFLIEACTRLIVGSGVEYDTIVRSRLDLTFHKRIVYKPNDGVRVNGRSVLTHADLAAGNKFGVYHYTYHCINDWFAIGPSRVMLQYGMQYSVVQSGNVSHFMRTGCLTEACISWTMKNVFGATWVAADFGVQLGIDIMPRMDVGKNGAMKCTYR